MTTVVNDYHGRSERMTTVVNDYSGNPCVQGTYSISIKDIANKLHLWLANRGEVQVEGFNKISAIKHIRDEFQYLGLRQAKDAVEYIQEREGEEWRKDSEERDRLEREILLASAALAGLQYQLRRIKEKLTL